MTYTLFRHHRRSDLYCAIPQDRPVPTFVRAPEWDYAGTTNPDRPRPDGFDEDVARFACEFQGYYTYRTQFMLE